MNVDTVTTLKQESSFVLASHFTSPIHHRALINSHDSSDLPLLSPLAPRPRPQCLIEMLSRERRGEQAKSLSEERSRLYIATD